MNTKVSIRPALAMITATLFTFASPALADGISAGTLIENTASATYDDGSGTQSVDSNTVTVRVDELLDVTVTSLDPGPISAGPGEAVLTFEIINQGNGPEAFELNANPAIAGNDFDTVVDSIAVDTNGNGTYDPGVDAILTEPETTDILQADESLTVFVIVTVPAGVADTDESDVELTASAVTGTGAPGTTFAGAGDGGGDAVVGAGGADDSAIGSLIVGVADVTLTKSANVTDPFGGTTVVPGSVITFSIAAEVSGSASVDSLTVTDAIPDDTTYVPGSLTLDTAPLTDVSDVDAGEADDASGISVALGTVAGGTTQTITFDVTID